MRLITLLWLVSTLSGCALFGPPSINYSRSDIEKQAIIDRRAGEFGQLFSGLDAIGLSGPDVGIMTTEQRLELAWSAKLPDGPLGLPLRLRIAVSGTPKLSANQQGIDLTDVRLEEFSVPFLNLGGGRMRQQDTKASLPLLQFDPSDLHRDGVVYRPDQISLDVFGMHVKLLPK